MVSKVAIQQQLLATRYEQPLRLVNIGFKLELFEGMKLNGGVNDLFEQGIEQGYYIVNDDSSMDKPSSTLPFPKEGQVYYLTVEYKF
jgi:outer membrane receptor for ferrienterochelin and colicin